MIYYKSKKQKNRRYAHLHINDIFEINNHREEFPKKFVLLLCCDSTDYPKKTLSEFASYLVKNGLCFLDIYGKGSGELEWIFDKELIDTNKSDIATVSYDDEKIDEALSYFINYASPSGKYKNTCKTWLCITIKNKAWEKNIKKVLTQVDKYYKNY